MNRYQSIKRIRIFSYSLLIVFSTKAFYLDSTYEEEGCRMSGPVLDERHFSDFGVKD